MKEPAHSLDELLELLAGAPFLVWMGGQAFLVAGILIATKLSSFLRPKLKHTPRMRMIRGIAYGCVRYVRFRYFLLEYMLIGRNFVI